jgi:hypothetical protein
MSIRKTYFIHNNYNRPFLVSIVNKNVTIYKIPSEKIDYNKPIEKSDYTQHVSSFTPQEIFIGKSPKIPMTVYSGGFGKAFDGNTILLKINDKKYIFISNKIYSFTPYAKIVRFVSPLGNNDVPYSYAVDINNNYYLLIESVVLPIKSKKINDPYEYYYSKKLITPNIGRVPPKKPLIPNFESISEYYIGKDKYTLTYVVNSEQDYNRLIPEYGLAMYIVKNGKKIKITKKDYVQIMKNFGKIYGFKKIKNIKILYK